MRARKGLSGVEVRYTMKPEVPNVSCRFCIYGNFDSSASGWAADRS